MQTLETFGALVKRLRLERALTLETVAKRIHSHKGYVSGIERGKVNPPSAKVVRRFAKVFGQVYERLLLLAELDKVHPDIRDDVRRMVEFGMERIIFPSKQTEAVPTPSAPTVGEKAAG